MNIAESLLSEWISQKVPLDFCIEELALTQSGIVGKKTAGECLVSKPSDSLVMLEMEDCYLPFVSREGFIIEFREDSPNGFQISIRTPNNKASVALKPHVQEVSE